MGRTDFSDLFRKKKIRHKHIGYNSNVMRQSECLVINPITIDSFAALFSCAPMDRAPDSMIARPKAIHFSWFGPELFRLLLGPPGSAVDLLLLRISSCVVWQTMDLHLSRNKLYLLRPHSI